MKQPFTRRIFLSSTAEDLQDHRQAVAKVIEGLGDAPVRMEFFGAQPNDPVSLCMKKAAGSDAVIVIVAHRYGWVPSKKQGGDDHKSITWLEVEAALQASRPVFAFIVDRKYGWPHSKEQDGLENAQNEKAALEVHRKVKALSEFREFLSSEAGLTRDTFTTPDNLAIKVSTSLGRWIREDEDAQRPRVKERPDTAMPADWVKTHLAALREQLWYVPVPIARKNRPERLELTAVYVPLKLVTSQRSHESQQAGYASLLKAPRIALTGDAGSGKSTLLRYIALEAGSNFLDQPDGPQEGVSADVAPRIPVYLNLARYSGEALRTSDSDTDSPSPIAPERWLPVFASALRLSESQAEFALKQGNLLLLLDGLDEVASAREREVLVESIVSLQRRYSSVHLQNHVIVGCREPAWGTGEPFASFDKVTIPPMEKETIDHFLSRWSRAFWGAEAERILGSLDQSLSSPAVRDLATNPQLSTLLALVDYDGDTPRQETRLYEQFVRRLGRASNDSGKIEEMRAQLQILAVAMQRTAGPDSEPLNALKAQEAKLLLAKMELPEGAPQVSGRKLSQQGERALRRLEIRTGLLEVDRPEGLGDSRAMVRFKHRTFQEYLAACYFAEEGVEELLDHVTDPAWSKVLALACGVLADVHEDDVRNLLEQILRTPDLQQDDIPPAQTLVDWAPRVAAASVCLAELASYDLDEQTLEPARRAHQLILPLLTEEQPRVDVRTRVRIAEGLGSIYDPRLKPELRWVTVPAGWFVRGSEADEAWIQERPGARLRLDEFRIQRWPVTIAEYRIFLEEEKGYKTDQWWPEEEAREWRDAAGIKAPKGWERNRARGNHPVTGVSWWEARAYCRWYTATTAVLPDGWRADLPLESQWEMAARGESPPGRETKPGIDADERAFPWGAEWLPDLSNSAETGLQHTVAVGLFPAGNSPYELWDMAGNISEHCLDAFGPYQPDTAKNQPSRKYPYGSSVRGGSFASQPLDLRVTYRFGIERHIQDEHVGFRCVGVPDGGGS